MTEKKMIVSRRKRNILSKSLKRKSQINMTAEAR